MGEPISSTTITGGAAAVAATGWWVGLDSGVVLGAFAGAVFFVISSTELKLPARAGYFFVSFIFGVLSGPWSAEIMSALIPGARSEAPVALGALVAAAIAIKLLLALSTKNMTGRVLSGFGGLLAAAVVKPKDTTKDE